MGASEWIGLGALVATLLGGAVWLGTRLGKRNLPAPVPKPTILPCMYHGMMPEEMTKLRNAAHEIKNYKKMLDDDLPRELARMENKLSTLEGRVNTHHENDEKHVTLNWKQEQSATLNRIDENLRALQEQIVSILTLVKVAK